jgi:hypothetical protein
VSTSNSRILEDVRIGVRLKISALWIAMLFLFAYGDIFGFPVHHDPRGYPSERVLGPGGSEQFRGFCGSVGCAVL